MNCPSCGYENLEGSDRCENCLSPFRQLDIPSADAAEGLARSVMADNLSRLDQEQTISVAPDTPALQVARLMKDSNSGCALVLDGSKLVGIFTEHDVLLKMTDGPMKADGSVNMGDGPTNANLSNPANVSVRDLMSPDPETLHERDSVAEALNKMSMGRYRHIPFQKSDGTYAVASIKSVLKYIAREDW